MALVNLTNLDFDQIKTSIKDYLRSNSSFSDYDFEGSNLSIILDILAYNTYISSYNASMVSNEVFIDSATLRENVVSLARNIGFVPKSRTASKCIISFFVDTTSFVNAPLTLTLKRGTVCVSAESFGNENYTFMIPEDITVPVVEGFAYFENIVVYEGSYATTRFVTDSTIENQKYILDNENIDTSTLYVTVRPSVSSTLVTKYNLVNSLVDVNKDSKIFFIQEISDQRYELMFGDNIFGKKLENGNLVEVSYCITNGINGNGIRNFDFAGRIFDNNDRLISDGISVITTQSVSEGGQEIQSINSIKTFAPKIYSTQYRAVTSADFEALIPTIYPEAEYVTAFGGEDLTPPQFGKVFIVIKPYNGQFISNSVKNNLKTTLKKYTVGGIKLELVDLKYVYVETASNVYYDQNKAPGADFVKSLISGNVSRYADTREINQYGAKFKYSRFLKVIDDSHESITSNITTVEIRRNLRPAINSLAEYELCYGNAFYVREEKNVGIAATASALSMSQVEQCDGYNLRSSGFRVEGINEIVYLSDFPNKDRKTGEVFLFSLNASSQPVIARRGVGTVNYTKGEVLLKPIKITGALKTFGGEPIIEISAPPLSNDVIGLQDLFLQYDQGNSTVNMVPDVISSGYDTSAISHKASPSYIIGKLVRK